MVDASELLVAIGNIAKVANAILFFIFSSLPFAFFDILSNYMIYIVNSKETYLKVFRHFLYFKNYKLILFTKVNINFI